MIHRGRTAAGIGVVLCFLLQTVANAGHETGNGGGGVVCRSGDGRILSAQLLDLWEAEATQLNPERKPEAVDRQITSQLAALTSASPAFGARVAVALSALWRIRRDLAPGFALAPPADTGEFIFQKGCAVEGIASYLDAVSLGQPPVLLVNPELYSALPNTDQAALWIHEAIYKVLRDDEGAVDSRKSRNFVGRLFGKPGLPALADGTWAAGLHCVSDLPGAYSRAYLNGEVLLTTSGAVTTYRILRAANQWVLPVAVGKVTDPTLARVIFYSHHPVPDRATFDALPPGYCSVTNAMNALCRISSDALDLSGVFPSTLAYLQSSRRNARVAMVSSIAQTGPQDLPCTQISASPRR